MDVAEELNNIYLDTTYLGEHVNDEALAIDFQELKMQ